MFLWQTLLPIWMKTKNLMMMKHLIMTKKSVKYFSMSMMKTQTQTLRRRRWRKSWISYTMYYKCIYL